MVQDVELSLETPTFHGLKYSLGSVKTPHQEHSNQVGIRSVGVHVSLGFECSHLHGITQAMIIFVDHMNVPETKKEEMYQFVGNPQTAQGMHKSENLGCAEKRYDHENNGI